MIEKLAKEKWALLIPELMENTAENYFNLLGLLSDKPVYKDVIIQKNKSGRTTGYIFHRLSGTIKFYARKEYDHKELAHFLVEYDFDKIIAPESCLAQLEESGILRKEKVRSYLCRFEGLENRELGDSCKIRTLQIEDLEEVVEIYMEVFKSFASLKLMKEKIESGRGRGIGLWNAGKMVSVAQTDFEETDRALIVGVATRLNHQRKGFGEILMRKLIDDLTEEGKRPFLEYENPDAGKLYKKLGFLVYDRVVEYRKTGKPFPNR